MSFFSYCEIILAVGFRVYLILYNIYILQKKTKNVLIEHHSLKLYKSVKNVSKTDY